MGFSLQLRFSTNYVVKFDQRSFFGYLASCTWDLFINDKSYNHGIFFVVFYVKLRTFSYIKVYGTAKRNRRKYYYKMTYESLSSSPSRPFFSILHFRLSLVTADTTKTHLPSRCQIFLSSNLFHIIHITWCKNLSRNI